MDRRFCGFIPLLRFEGDYCSQIEVCLFFSTDVATIRAAVLQRLIELYHSIQPKNWFTLSPLVTHSTQCSPLANAGIDRVIVCGSIGTAGLPLSICSVLSLAAQRVYSKSRGRRRDVLAVAILVSEKQN